MRIWLVTVGEPLPFDAMGQRLLRTGILQEILADFGHEVVWWTSTFDHVRKAQRFSQDRTVELGNSVTVRLLHGCGYRRNVSLQRIIEHRVVARKFTRQSRELAHPDVILCSLPTLELALACSRYGKEYDVPVVIDVRDLWPDVILNLFPIGLRALGRALLWPMQRQAQEAMVNAHAITSNSPPFIEWGLRIAGRKATALDRSFPFGYVSDAPSESEQHRAWEFWRQHRIQKDQQRFIACFFGSFSGQFDLETVVRAALHLEHQGVDVRFVLCGTGERLDAMKQLAGSSVSLIFPGWIGRAEIWALMQVSSAGLAPYRNHLGFSDNMPNKPIEYFSSGLPVLSSLKGYLGALLEAEQCGLIYEERAESLADAVLQLVNDTALLARLSTNAQRIFADRFEAKHVYGAMAGYLEDVATHFRRAREEQRPIASSDSAH